MPGNLRIAFDFDDKEHTVMLTVAEDDCDPAYEVLSSLDLPQTLEKIPDFVQAARTKWETEPRYVKYAKPKAPRAKKAEATKAPPAEKAAAQSTPPAEGEASLEEAESRTRLEEAESEARLEEAEEEARPVAAGELPLLGQPSESGDEATAESPDPEGVAQAVEASAEAPPAPQASEEPAAEVPAPSPSSNGSGKGKYKVVGQGTTLFDSVHDALRALGVTQADIDHHKYWHRLDRLPKKYHDQIEKVAA